MATATPTRTSTAQIDHRVELRDIDWKGYTTILRLRGERPRPRILYLDGNLVLMTTSLPHERYRKILDRFVMVVVEEFQLPCFQTGSTTFRRRRKKGGVEGDETYYLANAARVRGKAKINLKVDPPPDLAIEVVHTNPVEPALEVYQRLGVPEVWVLEDDELRFLILQTNGTYTESKTSSAFPFLNATEVQDWVTRPLANDDTAWLIELRRWVRNVLVLRPRPGVSGP